jgi:putative DNA primase/helicase
MSQNKPLSLDDAWQMLLAIDPHDRETWLKILMALKSYFGDDGFALAEDWSQRGDNYNASALRSTWRSCRGSGVGIGTLFYFAKQSGWRPDVPSTPAPAPAPRRAPMPQQSSTATYAAELWRKANAWMDDDNWLAHPSPDETVITHPYAIAKRIVSAGGAVRGIASGRIIGKNADCIIVPIRMDGDGAVQGVQCINPDGAKQTFGSMTGGYLLIGNTLDKGQIWYVLEGWASAYALVVHHLNGEACAAVSFGKGNQQKVAEMIAHTHKPQRVRKLMEQD